MGFLQTTKKFFEPVRVMPRQHIKNMFEGIYAFVFSVFTIEILKIILNSIENNNNEIFWKYIIIYFIGTIILSIGQFFTYKWGWCEVYFDGQKYYYEKYLEIFVNAEGNEVEKIGTGRFISILKNGVADWIEMLFELGQGGLYGVLFLLYAIFTVFRINLIGGVLSLILIIISGFIAYKANIYMRDKRLSRKKAEREAEHQAVITLMSKNELLQNNGLKNFSSKISNNFEMAKNYQYPVNIGFTVVDVLPKLTFLIIRIGIYLYMSYSIYNKTSSFAELTIFITIITLTETALGNFFDIVRMILRKFGSLELLWNTFDNLTPIKGYDKGESFSIKSDKIILKDVDYSYTKNKKIFDKFSIEIEGNKKTALVGVSGGGKTTLMKIIAGYLRQQKGSVEIFGNDLKKTSLKSYFENIGYLTQEPSVFDGTIRENLQASVGKISRRISEDEKQKISENKNEEEIFIQALKDAECNFVFEFEDGIDTEIGEKGIRLSGGQRQRLAIAKIFIKNPKIILLDEPTSALDSFSEEKITKAMHKLFKGRTVIIIAHRLQTVKEADDIILIEDGKIVERGTHKELIKQKGVYKKMLDLQSGF